MSATTTTTSPSPSPVPSTPVWHATVQASVTRVTVDVIQTIDYTNGLFTQRNQVVDGVSSQAIVVLDSRARRQLLRELEAELAAPPPGTDLGALKVFVDLLHVSLRRGRSPR